AAARVRPADDPNAAASRPRRPGRRVPGGVRSRRRDGEPRRRRILGEVLAGVGQAVDPLPLEVPSRVEVGEAPAGRPAEPVDAAGVQSRPGEAGAHDEVLDGPRVYHPGRGARHGGDGGPGPGRLRAHVRPAAAAVRHGRAGGRPVAAREEVPSRRGGGGRRGGGRPAAGRVHRRRWGRRSDCRSRPAPPRWGQGQGG
ncbi:hypothetical protein THAOC_10704, partial [Thalassiosira oceanica]